MFTYIWVNSKKVVYSLLSRQLQINNIKINIICIRIILDDKKNKHCKFYFNFCDDEEPMLSHFDDIVYLAF